MLSKINMLLTDYNNDSSQRGLGPIGPIIDFAQHGYTAPGPTGFNGYTGYTGSVGRASAPTFTRHEQEQLRVLTSLIGRLKTLETKALEDRKYAITLVLNANHLFYKDVHSIIADYADLE